MDTCLYSTNQGEMMFFLTKLLLP
ncbi:nuclease, partial [Salmonella enterica subsp. enterica serovar Kentucky]|nr:nuclease [Salmonella enterica subsp. enterica serovar Kentucky]